MKGMIVDRITAAFSVQSMDLSSQAHREKRSSENLRLYTVTKSQTETSRELTNFGPSSFPYDSAAAASTSMLLCTGKCPFMGTFGGLLSTSIAESCDWKALAYCEPESCKMKAVKSETLKWWQADTFINIQKLNKSE